MSGKEKLEGRIYPAIKSCVNNRYKIIAGIFSVYAFMKSSLNTGILTSKVSIYVAFIFTFFVLHNTLNYYLNLVEQQKIENNKVIKSKLFWDYFNVEGVFAIVMLLIIWSGYWFVIKE